MADDEPSTSRAIAELVCGEPASLPESVSADQVDETRRANRRVNGRAIRDRLGVTLRYPSYRQGVPASLERSSRMRREWDERARENAYHYVASGRETWTLDEFLESGRESVETHIVADLERISGGRQPRELSMLEIGCGAGRMTAALADLFGEVHALDVSPVMLSHAEQHLSAKPNVTLHLGDGRTLDALGDRSFDLIFSYIVFQHIPDKDAIESYIRAAAERLRPGGVLNFQVQGADAGDAGAFDSWRGAPVSAADAVRLCRETGCELADFSGLGEQYFWLWFRKPGAVPGPDRCVELLLAEVERRREMIRGLEGLLAERTAWARSRDERVEQLDQRIVQLQQELEASNGWALRLNAQIEAFGAEVLRLQRESAERTAWARERDAHADELAVEIERLNRELEERTRWARGLEAELDERTRWAQRLHAELEALRVELAAIERAPAYRIGARLGVIPQRRP